MNYEFMMIFYSMDFVDAELLEGMWMEVEFETKDVGDDKVRGKQLYKLM